MQPYAWQKAIMNVEADPLTKLVCYTISNFMPNDGSFAFPSLNTLAAGCNIARSSVQKAIAQAVEVELLTKTTRRRDNGSHTSNAYHPNIPDALYRAAAQGVPSGGIGVCREGGPLNRPSEQTTETNSKSGHSHFEKFWQAFPKQRAGSKEKASAAFNRAVSRCGDPQAIVMGAHAYAASDEVARGYAKGAAAWLNDDRWTVNYRRGPGKPQTTDKGIPVLSEYDRNPML